MFKVLNNYEAHWQRHFKYTLLLKILRTWINIHANFFLGKYHEMKMGEGALGIISFKPALWRILHQDISLIIVLFFSSQINPVFKFNLVLTE